MKRKGIIGLILGGLALLFGFISINRKVDDVYDEMRYFEYRHGWEDRKSFERHCLEASRKL